MKTSRMSPLFQVSACAILILASSACRKPAKPAAPPPPAVRVANPVSGEVITYSEFPATLQATSSAEIRARVSGILQKVTFKEGSMVKEGALLFVIEPDPYELALEAATADLARAQAGSELAQKRHDRLAQALSKNAVSQIDVEVAAAELSQAAAGVSQAKVKVENAKLQLGYTKIHAPFSGRISRDLAGENNLVGYAESTVLTHLVDDSRMAAYFEVPERDVIRYLEARANVDAAKLVMQKDIALRLADGSTYDIPGHINFIDNVVDPKTRTITVRAEFENPRGTLAAGLYGLVRIPVGPNPQDPSQKQALTIPALAVQRDIAGSFVWIVDDSNVVRRQSVTTGRQIDPATEGGERSSIIISGLTVKDRVIVGGIQRVREGAPVQISTPNVSTAPAGSGADKPASSR